MRKVHRATMSGGLFLVVMQQLELPNRENGCLAEFCTMGVRVNEMIYGV